MKLCMGCMNQIEEHITTCPYCGFNEKTNRQESYYLNPGTVVGGKYIVGKVMSYSGYTISYIGMDAESERKVVIREYLPSDFATRSEGETDITIYAGDAVQQFEYGLTTFLNDANTMQKLGMLEGISQVYDCISENDTGYVVSEYVEGRTLKDILQKDKKIAPDKAKRIIEKLLSGLCKLHANGIVHCDISPESVIITDNGNVKLTDFGAAKYVTTANSKSLAIILKQGYAPEEQYRSKGIRGPWTDVYAVAAVMYRMITGIVPPESVDRALMDNLKEPSKLGIEISESMENAIMNALNIYKDNRTASAERFLKELNSDKVQRIKVKKNKNTTGKIPLWCKIMVACFTVVIAVGGVILFNANSKNDKEFESKEILMEDIEGKKEDNIGNLKEKYKKDGIVLTLDKEGGEWEFNANYESKDNKISSYYVKRGETEVDIDSGDKLEKGDKIYYKIGRNDAIHYSDLCDSGNVLNKNDIEEKFGKQADEYEYPPEVADEDKLSWGEIVCIKYKDEDGNQQTIENNDIKELINKKDKFIELEKIDNIYYSTELFIYTESVGSYVGRNISDSIELPRCKLGKKNNIKEEETTAINGTALNDDYYSIAQKDGYIFNQTKSEGEKYDQRDNEPLLEVIGKGLGYKQGTTKLSELYGWQREVEEDGATQIIIKDNKGVELKNNEKSNYVIKGYKIETKENLIDKNIFPKGSEVTIKVELIVPTPTPSPTKVPATTKAPTKEPTEASTKEPTKDDHLGGEIN